MVAYRPETLEGMALLHGIGQRKHARYSAGFLEVLQPTPRSTAGRATCPSCPRPRRENPGA